MEDRLAAFCFFIGHNGTGKSTAMKHFLKANKRNLVFPSSALDKAWDGFEKIQPKRVAVEDKKARPGNPKMKYVYRLVGINQFQGTRVVDLSEITEAEELIDLFQSVIIGAGCFKKGGLFIDDFKNYVPSHGKLPYAVKKLMSNYRHLEQDLFFATHSFNEVNGQFFAHNPVFYLFKSDNPPNATYLRHYRQADALLATYNAVQERAKSNRYFCARFPSSAEALANAGHDPENEE